MGVYKEILYFLNGKPASKEVIAKRKAKLSRKYVTEKRYFEAPLTEEEKEVRRIEAINTSNAFARMRQDREDLEARHG